MGVHNFPNKGNPLPSVENGGEPPYDDGMEARVVKLEDFAVETRERLTRIETKLDATATKADLVEAINGQIKWMVATAVVLAVAAITIMTFVLNNATPKAALATSAPQPPAIIINVPPSAPASTAPSLPPPATGTRP